MLVGLNAAGLDLTTLNVLTGAIGIGLGFGLQSIAANFVSGFVLLMDRSIKPGDVISFTGMPGTTTEGFGWVEELRGRYVVVRDRDGVETLVPNQNLITNPVINWSYTDPRVRLKLPIRVSYKDDPERAMQLLLEATHGHPRIIREPAPVARLMGFGDHGIELELRFWIPDPQEGVNNVRSDVNRRIWTLFQEHGDHHPGRAARSTRRDGGALARRAARLKPCRSRSPVRSRSPTSCWSSGRCARRARAARTSTRSPMPSSCVSMPRAGKRCRRTQGRACVASPVVA